MVTEPAPAATSRLAAAVRTARLRNGWSRETLAHESGLSWSAVTQIESGRRADVRVSTLLALGSALGVSLDYLVADRPAAPMLEHVAYLCETADDVVEHVSRAVGAARDGGRSVLVVTTPENLDALGEVVAGGTVSVGVSSDWYREPAVTTARYAEFVTGSRARGAHWAHIVGEPVWAGQTPTQQAAWTRYESMLNSIFATWPVTIGCLYDLRRVPKRAGASVERTHPEVATVDQRRPSDRYEVPEQFVTS